ncbi:hypothetical protein PR202_ga09252 [Eleusine coracana subsp. coracana]|uniref:Uncharacterized protein n=1 Tax=Eleusine coracana subsp. coracana TaxID=191504 RepID=A0AAV5C4M8_ELECO|nr:hypothetical protein PR202_ga09252 [Eleusine coracana subsp. coracana]
MEARRVLTARRLSSARRVLARKRQRPSASANSARKLQQREIAAGPGNSFAASFTRERFCSIRLQVAMELGPIAMELHPTATSFAPQPWSSVRRPRVRVVAARTRATAGGGGSDRERRRW